MRPFFLVYKNGRTLKVEVQIANSRCVGRVRLLRLWTNDEPPASA
jgi:hypothetical protein